MHISYGTGVFPPRTKVLDGEHRTETDKTYVGLDCRCVVLGQEELGGRNVYYNGSSIPPPRCCYF